MSYAITYMWNLKKSTHWTSLRNRNWLRLWQTYGYQRRQVGAGGGMAWGFGMKCKTGVWWWLYDYKYNTSHWGKKKKKKKSHFINTPKTPLSLWRFQELAQLCAKSQGQISNLFSYITMIRVLVYCLLFAIRTLSILIIVVVNACSDNTKSLPYLSCFWCLLCLLKLYFLVF